MEIGEITTLYLGTQVGGGSKCDRLQIVELFVHHLHIRWSSDIGGTFLVAKSLAKFGIGLNNWERANATPPTHPLHNKPDQKASLKQEAAAGESSCQNVDKC